MVLALVGITCVFATAPVAVVLGVVSILRIQRSRGKLKGAAIAVLAIMIAEAGGIWTYYVGIPRIRSISPRMVCGTNLSGLGKAILLYAADNNDTYPTPEKWCDLLLEREDVTEKMFRCPGNKNLRCAYAINPNCHINSSPDTVLLFEARTSWNVDGWNRVGGQELLSFSNHEGDGCNILFNDCQRRFVRATVDELCSLNWNDDSRMKLP